MSNRDELARALAQLNEAQNILTRLMGGPAAQQPPSAPRPAPAPAAGGAHASMEDLNYALKVGKYKGWTLQQVAAEDQQYLMWLSENWGLDENGRPSGEAKWHAANQKLRDTARRVLAWVETPQQGSPAAPAASSYDYPPNDDIPF